MDYNQRWSQRPGVLGRGPLRGSHPRERGLFAPVAKTFTTDVAFDSDQIYSLATGDMTGEGAALADRPERRRRRRPRGLLARGQSISSKRSELRGAFRRADTRWRHRVRLGGRGHVPVGRQHPARDGPARLRSRRPGRLLMFTTIEVGSSRAASGRASEGLMGDDIWPRILSSTKLEDGLYPDEPNAIAQNPVRRCAQPSRAGVGAPGHRASRADARRVERRKQPVGRAHSTGTLLIGDVTGDRRSDLLIESEFTEHSTSLSACRGRTCSPGELTRWRSPSPATGNTRGWWTSTGTASRTSSCITRPVASPCTATTRPLRCLG